MTGAILAGGRSRRMGGGDKALLEVDGRPMIERTALLFEKLFSHRMIVTDKHADYAFLGIRMVSDLIPGLGVLGGLFTALFFSETQHVFVTGCDMPFLQENVIRLLMERRRKWDVVVPKVGPNYEPLHAVYSKKCIPHIETVLLKGGRKIVDFYDKVKVRPVPEADIRAPDPELLSFRNVNTPEDLAAIRNPAE